MALNLAGLEKGTDKIKVDEFFSIPSELLEELDFMIEDARTLVDHDWHSTK